MGVEPLRRWLMTEGSRWSDPRVFCWLGLSLLFAGYYGWLGLQAAYDGAYVLQDDARQHVFWMLRFVDPELLRDDLIADYFQSIAPAGYTALYRLVAALGVHPFDFSKILPTVLGLITTAFCFRFSLLVVPLPVAAFAATLLLNQTLWMKPDLISGTPRAFAYLVLLVFLCAYQQRRLIAMLIAIALQAAFYPQCAILSGGVLCLGLLRLNDGRPALSDRKEDYWFACPGIALVLLLLGSYALQISGFGSTVTAEEARVMPEFLPGGRNSGYLHETLLDLWIGSKTGPLPQPIMTPVTLLFSLGFPFLLAKPGRFPLMARVRANGGPMLLLLLASLSAFALAHLVLFKLHGPGRYSHHSLRILFALASGFTIVALADRLLAWAGPSGPRRSSRVGLALGFTVFAAVGLMGYSLFLKKFPIHGYAYGSKPALYAVIRQQPKDALIASLSSEADNLASFAERPVLVSKEHSIAYHKAYYGQIRERASDLIAAQYAPDPETLRAVIDNYGIDLWLLDERWRDVAYIEENGWLKQYQPAAAEAITDLGAGREPALLRLVAPCTLFEGEGVILLDAQCILESESEKAP